MVRRLAGIARHDGHSHHFRARKSARKGWGSGTASLAHQGLLGAGLHHHDLAHQSRCNVVAGASHLNRASPGDPAAESCFVRYGGLPFSPGSAQAPAVARAPCSPYAEHHRRQMACKRSRGLPVYPLYARGEWLCRNWQERRSRKTYYRQILVRLSAPRKKMS